MNASPIICYEVIVADTDAETKLKNKDKSSNAELCQKEGERNVNEKKATCDMQNFYVLLTFLLITIALLIAVRIYCYLIKDQAKQLLPFHHTNNELREVLYS